MNPMPGPGPHRAFTQPWADAFHHLVEADAAYRAAAGGWHWPLALVVDAEPALGIPEPLAIQAELHAGRSRGVRALPAARVTAPYVLRASLATWKAVMRGELDAIPAVMSGRLTLERGALATLLFHTTSATRLVEVARRVPTFFPEGGVTRPRPEPAAG